MVEEKINIGYGLVAWSDTCKEEVLETLDITTQVTFGRETLIPGQGTSLGGFFSKPVEFCGTIQPEGMKMRYMYFYLGEDATLFSTKHYFEKIALIADNKFYCHFTESGGRDYNFKNNTWDWERSSSKKKRVDPELEEIFDEG